jgi:hypothetical protein
MNEIEYEDSIKVFIEELNACLLKFKESTNNNLIPSIMFLGDLRMIKKLNENNNTLLTFEADEDKFISLSNGQVLGIKNWKEYPQSFIDIKTFEYKESSHSSRVSPVVG